MYDFVQDLETKWREAYRTTTTEQAINNLNNETIYSKKMKGYYSEINVSTSDISKYNIKDINNLKVLNKIQSSRIF